jgi:hypothetical protein
VISEGITPWSCHPGGLTRDLDIDDSNVCETPGRAVYGFHRLDPPRAKCATARV